ncbi:hypothetical protein V7112_23595 [Bacillus sp. JJ1566]|uniref:hypothetical protein n=1 Tax=Bacillus sp. JJ1566 TaxID=3122961 RepID=UPI002FFD638F
MRKVFLPFLFLVILSLFACQANDNGLTFMGEGNDWSAELSVNQNDGKETYEIKLIYKGDNIEEIETFRYNIKSRNGVVDYNDKNVELNEEGIYKNNLLSENSDSTSSEDEIVIEMEWNDKGESFNLRSK